MMKTHECDLISRQAAIDFIVAGRFVNPNEPRWSDNEVVNFIKSRPSAQTERKTGRWIPCSEKLPDNGRQVLVFARSVHFALAKYDEMREADGTYKKQWVTFDAWKPFYTIKEVIAWRELPEPYKGGAGWLSS